MISILAPHFLGFACNRERASHSHEFASLSKVIGFRKVQFADVFLTGRPRATASVERRPVEKNFIPTHDFGRNVRAAPCTRMTPESRR